MGSHISFEKKCSKIGSIHNIFQMIYDFTWALLVTPVILVSHSLSQGVVFALEVYDNAIVNGVFVR
jgi:hypothetical protein